MTTKAPGTQDHRILLVTPDADRRQTLVVWLTAAGHSPTALSTFEQARHELEARLYTLVVTDVKLGAFNGLQLVIRERLRGGARAIVLGQVDSVLEAEAERHGAIYLDDPLDRDRFLAAISEVLASRNPSRRSPRRLAAGLDATVNERPARVLDVSYEGLRLEVDFGAVGLPTSFMVKVRSLPVGFQAKRVWTSEEVMPAVPPKHEHPVQCGAQLGAMDTDTFMLWRTLVDSLPRTTTPN